LSGRGLCDELITRPEESYRLWCVVVCDLETSRMGAPYIYIYDISRLRVNLYSIIHLPLGLRRSLVPLVFPTKYSYQFMSAPIRATYPTHLISVDLIT
jgi:hypothetical protein